MAVLYVQHYQQFFDGTGAPLAYGKLYTYAAGTTTLKATYTDASAATAHPNPIILDASGKPDVGGCIFLEGSYKFVLHDSNDSPIADGTRDNITSFTAYSESNSGFFQTFSGDAVGTTFTLTDDLGNDEKSLMVFSELERSTNGTFASDTSWTKGAGWTIAAGVATATGAISTSLEQSAGVSLIHGKSYLVKYTVTRSAGTITPSLGGTAGTARSASGDYSEIIIAGSSQLISFATSGFTGTLDSVSVRDVGGLTIRNPADYTLDGDELIFLKPPASGTNNIYVFAPYTLIGAAGAAQTAADAAIAAQSAAELAETNAETAETNAEAAAASVAGLSSTSTTSLAIGTGTKAFTTQTGKGYTAGQWIIAVSAADSANYMHGSVTSYSGSTLTTSITNTGGSGTLADWNISVSGTRGATGATGSISDFSGTTTATLAAADLMLFSDNSASGASRVSTPPNINLAIFGSGSATSGQVLTANGTGGNSYATVSSGLVPIKTVTVSSPVSSVDFVNGSGGVVLDSTYKRYAIIYSDIVPSSDGDTFMMRTSTNSGSSYDSGSSDYQWAFVRLEVGSSVTEGTSTGSNNNTLCTQVVGSESSTGCINGRVDLLNIVGARYKAFEMSALAVNNTTSRAEWGFGRRLSTTDINAIRFFFPTGNIASGTLTLCGYKGA